jgi:hypothetical protein
MVLAIVHLAASRHTRHESVWRLAEVSHRSDKMSRAIEAAAAAAAAAVAAAEAVEEDFTQACAFFDELIDEMEVMFPVWLEGSEAQ